MTNDTPSRTESGHEVEPPQPPAPEVAAAVPSPGAMLREARDAAGMAVEELAEAAKLSPGIIVALEADDFARLNEPVYVRGYYRKCALILGIDTERLTRAYDVKAKPQAPPLPSQIPLVAGGGVGFLRRLARGLLILLILVLLAGAVLWLLQPGPVDREFGLLDDRPSFGAGRDAAPAEDPATPAAAAPETVEADVAAEQPAAARADAPAAAEASSALRVYMREESWLRVQDRRGNNLANELVPAGETRSFRQAPPLEVFLGNAPGVEITWRGEDIDLAPRTRGNNTALVRVE